MLHLAHNVGMQKEINPEMIVKIQPHYLVNLSSEQFSMCAFVWEYCLNAGLIKSLSKGHGLLCITKMEISWSL